MNKIKKLFITLITTVMVFAMSTVAFASEESITTESPVVDLVQGEIYEVPENAVLPEVTDEQGPMTRAISGSGSDFGNQGTIYVYSPGSSWLAHVVIKTEYTNSPIYIACYDPNGRLINPRLSGDIDFVAMSGNNTIGLNFHNAPAGTYKLVYAVADASNTQITFSLHDLIW